MRGYQVRVKLERSVIGHRLNNYEITRLIGSGAMGAVYEAQHPIIRRKVAVKVLQNQLSRDPVAVQRFFEEARVTSTIRHPHIVEIIDVGMLPDGVPYLIMELLEGESLACRLERVGRLDTAVALNLVLQAAAGLEAAHAHGVIHRDLKPDHLFLMPDQRLPGQELVKVLDFGIAKLRGTPPRPRIETHSGTVMGTPLYMSPEQCSGLSSAVDQRTDIYALGVILYEALCGQPPFVAAGIGDILMMHTATAPVPPSVHRADLPARVEHLVLTALAKRADQRFASMGDLMAAIRSARTSTQRFVSPSFEPLEMPMRRVPQKSEPELGNPAFRASPIPEVAPSKPLGSDTERTATESSPLGTSSVRSRSKRSLLVRSLVATLAIAILVVIARGRWYADTIEAEALTSSGMSGPASSTVAASEHDGNEHVASDEHVVNEHVVNEHKGHPLILPDDPRAPLPPPSQSVSVAPPSKPITPVHPLAPTTAALPNGALPTLGAHPAGPLPRGAPKPAEVLAEPAASLPSSVQGYLSLDSAPWAEVYLGSKLLGSTPLLRVAIAPGKYELTLKNPELNRSTTYVVEVKAGSTVSRFVGWEQEGR
jgi:eukaryotic-like serine/threonine-protein kinase